MTVQSGGGGVASLPLVVLKKVWDKNKEKLRIKLISSVLGCLIVPGLVFGNNSRMFTKCRIISQDDWYTNVRWNYNLFCRYFK